jgi:23S rRNA (pseudouridine1915-N3)-methyltransferase
LRIEILSVGKPKNRHLVALHDDYAARMERLGVRYRSRFVPEVRPTGRFTDEHIREREARGLLEALEKDGNVVALDPSGRSLTSEAVARHLLRWTRTRVTFVIGGPLGLHRSLLDRADWEWSLSSLTLPHEMARALLAEQLYRAVTIVRRVPYHK